MTAKEYYNNQDRFEYFTKLTNTGIDDDFDEIMAFAEAYHEHKLKLLSVADVSDSVCDCEEHLSLYPNGLYRCTKCWDWWYR